ncbi:MAG: biosynthetic-type acetolactate synthase large subunit [Thermotogae bacterium]|nr:MAG: biosynthetic-type acetolactate synthase large subunit [Thermotogota bacterium]
MRGSKMLFEAFKRERVEKIFGIPGGAIIHVYDELCSYENEMDFFLFRHEQGATHAADGYARSTGKPGVVLVTSGPGATNTVTGIATAYMDSVPLVVITGQVSTSAIGTDAFQEVDITGVSMPITKHNHLVTSVEELPQVLKEAFHIATTGRPGPVLIDLPKSLQTAEGEFRYPRKLEIPGYKPTLVGHPRQIKRAVELLKNSKKPLVIAGGGVNLSGTAHLLNQFLDKFGIPVVNTLMGHGLNPQDERLYLGGIGMHGSYYGNYAVVNADLIVALGVRFSDRITGDPKRFAPNAKIVHVDVDPAEIGKNVQVDVPVVGDLKNVLEEFLKFDFEADYSEWIEELQKVKESHPLTYEKHEKFIKPQHVVEAASRYFPPDTVVAADVGQNQMWVAQFYRFRNPRSFLCSGGLGTMGYALPAGIGAKIGNPHKEVLVIAGDGGFQMNIQELMTINRYKLPVKVIVLDNSALGMVRQWQQLFFGCRYSATVLNDNPDFAKIAEDVGIKALRIRRPDDVEGAIDVLVHSKEPMLIHALVDPRENVIPMVPPGGDIGQPLLSAPYDKEILQKTRGEQDE